MMHEISLHYTFKLADCISKILLEIYFSSLFDITYTLSKFGSLNLPYIYIMG